MRSLTFLWRTHIWERSKANVQFIGFQIFHHSLHQLGLFNTGKPSLSICSWELKMLGLTFVWWMCSTGHDIRLSRWLALLTSETPLPSSLTPLHKQRSRVSRLTASASVSTISPADAQYLAVFRLIFIKNSITFLWKSTALPSASVNTCTRFIPKCPLQGWFQHRSSSGKVLA